MTAIHNPQAAIRNTGSRAVAAAVVAGVCLRVLFALAYWIDKPLTHDEQEYLHLAQNAAAGQGLTYDAPDGAEVERFGRAPLYPLVLSVFARMTPSPHLLATIRIAQSILGAVAIVLIARVAEQSAGPKAGLIAAWITALYPPLVWMPAYVLSESLYLPLALADVLLLGQAIARRPGASSWLLVACGVVGGLAALTRPVHVVFLIVVGCWLLLRRQVRWAMLITVGAFVVIAPWTARNYQHYGRLVLIASEGGITFWTGNHPLSTGEGDMAANPDIKRDNQRLRAAHPGLTAEELEPIYYREAFARIVSRPLWWIGLEVKKLFYLIVPIGPSYTLHSARYLTATLVSYGVLLPLGCAGLLALSRQRRTPVALALWVLSAIVAALIFFPQERFRIPLIDPALIAGAAAFIAHRIAPASAVEPRAQG